VTNAFLAVDVNPLAPLEQLPQATTSTLLMPTSVLIVAHAQISVPLALSRANNND
jgi:hypothetical protein